MKRKSMNFEFEMRIHARVGLFEGMMIDEEIYALISGRGTVIVDHNYGADADGNRGVTEYMIDEMDYKATDEKGRDITDYIAEDDRTRIDNKASDILITKFQEEGF